MSRTISTVVPSHSAAEWVCKMVGKASQREFVVGYFAFHKLKTGWHSNNAATLEKDILNLLLPFQSFVLQDIAFYIFLGVIQSSSSFRSWGKYNLDSAKVLKATHQDSTWIYTIWLFNKNMHIKHNQIILSAFKSVPETLLGAYYACI